jgi:uncharacterized membrane protein YfcA
LPGVLVGYYIRVRYLPDPRVFKFFVGMVLLYVGGRLIKSLINGKTSEKVSCREDFRIYNISYSLKRIEYDFLKERVSFSAPAVFILSAVVGIIGGIYGIGGGSIIAPFCVTILGLPVHTVAGAVLMGNLMTSIAGLVFYSLIPWNNGLAVPPDWMLGILFGFGGIVGMSLGARTQKYIPERVIKIILSAVILTVSAKYIWQFFA